MFKDLKTGKNISLIFVIYVAVCIVFILVVRNFTGNQMEKELVKVQTHISSLIDIRSAAVQNWIQDKKGAVESVSNNLTLKMYLSAINNPATDKDDVLTQEQFTAAYLNSVADNAGFRGKLKDNAIRANVEQNSAATLIVVDKKFNATLSVDYADNLAPIIGELMALPNEKEATIITNEKDGASYLRIIKKINNLQSDDAIGYVVAVKKLDKDFFKLLDFPPVEYRTSNSEVVFKKGTVLQYITDKPGSNSVIALQGNEELAELYAVNNPDIIAQKNNANGEKVFVSAKDLGYDGIFLVHSVSYKESYVDAVKNAKSLRVISYLICLILGAVLAFVWKHSTSEKFRKLLAEVQEKQRLLQMISENQIQSMFLIDNDRNVVFANKVFEKKNKMKDVSEYKDKPLENVVGAGASQDYLDLVHKAQEAHHSVTSLSKTKTAHRERYVQQRAIPISVDETDNHFHGSLIIENDITDLINERLKYEENLNNSIEILVKIIENRSKYFHNHGQQVHALSARIGNNLDISENHKKAIEIASRISNLSLALLPRNLINKEGELTKEEKDLFNSIPQKTIEIIKDFNFDSPVIETLEQINERVDGKGPNKLAGDNIIIGARIIKVVNDYVAMISDRPHRKALAPEAAIENLLKDKDTKYSKEVVFALANLVSKK